MTALLSAPRKVGARVTFEIKPEAYLIGKRAAWVILDTKPQDPRRSPRGRYNMRLTIARVSFDDIPPGAQLIPWVWDRWPRRNPGN